MRPEFYVQRDAEGPGITCTYRTSGGRSSCWHFNTPQHTLDDVSDCYIMERFGNVRTKIQAEFIKRRYKEEYARVFPVTKREGRARPPPLAVCISCNEDQEERGGCDMSDNNGRECIVKFAEGKQFGTIVGETDTDFTVELESGEVKTVQKDIVLL